MRGERKSPEVTHWRFGKVVNPSLCKPSDYAPMYQNSTLSYEDVRTIGLVLERFYNSLAPPGIFLVA